MKKQAPIFRFGPIEPGPVLRLMMLIFPLLVMATPVWSQQKITWKTLEDVKFTEKYSPEEEANYYFPHFGSTVKGLHGKEVYLEGYLLVIDPQAGYYILSKSPMASCFFCGIGGPETIVELRPKPGQQFKMDEIVTIKGRLKLNNSDIYSCNYIFEQAERYRP